jgi:MYXO-CTERM domain-containing protein
VKQCVPPYYSEAGVSRDDGSAAPTFGAGGAANGSGKGAAPEAAAGKSPTESSAGCSVALGSRAGGGALALFALGLVGLLRRRRSLHASR